MKRYEAEHATEELIAAMAGEDVKALELALLRAREAEVDANLIQDAEAALQDLRELAAHGPERREAEAELQAAIDAGDLVLLEAALAKARALRVSEEVLRAAQSVLTAAEAQSDLFRAMDGRNIQALMAALQRAESAGVDAGYLHMAQERLRALQEADHAEDDILQTLQQRDHDFDVPRRPSLHHADTSSHASLDTRPSRATYMTQRSEGELAFALSKGQGQREDPRSNSKDKKKAPFRPSLMGQALIDGGTLMLWKSGQSNGPAPRPASTDPPAGERPGSSEGAAESLPGSGFRQADARPGSASNARRPLPERPRSAAATRPPPSRPLSAKPR